MHLDDTRYEHYGKLWVEIPGEEEYLPFEIYCTFPRPNMALSCTLSTLARFARNGGVDAKDFQRMWREMEKASPRNGGPLGSTEGTSSLGGDRGNTGPQQDRRGREGGDGIGPEKIFEVGT